MKAVRILVGLTALTVGLFLASPAAVAQSSNASPCAAGGPNNNPNGQYPPKDCGVGANRTTVAPGGTITLTGTCPAGTDTVTFTLIPGNRDLGFATPAADGSYTKDVTIPSDTKPGNYQIRATCTGVLGNNVQRSVAITVVAAAGLPRTGAASVLPLTGTGIALVVVGGLAVLAVRRRRSTRPTA